MRVLEVVYYTAALLQARLKGVKNQVTFGFGRLPDHKIPLSNM